MLKNNFSYKCIFALCAILSFFTSSNSFAQGESSNWFFGRNAGINFSDDIARPLENSAIQTNEGCASISNSEGELLFYTDGILVWDRNHNVMSNGSNLLGNKSSTQSAVIVPKPNTDSIYYIFTVINLGNSEGVKYSEVDMTLNGGNGDITFNKNITLTGRSTEKISAVQHANGTDYWIATHTWNSDEFSVFKITETGVEITPVNSNVGSFHGGVTFNSIGYMKFSPNGKRLALAKWSTDSSVEIFDFDSSTGVLSNPINLDNFFGRNYENGAYGVEFSPNSNNLYVTELDLSAYESKLHQFDLKTYNRLAILASDRIIYQGRDVLAAIQLASNGKIYVCNAFSTHLNVIQNPNFEGLSCGYLQRSTSLGINSAVYGLPTFIQSLFVANIEIVNACLSGETQFSIETDESIDSVSWDFGDFQTSNNISPSHNFLSTGEYIVKAKIKSGNSIINLNRKVIIYESPVAYRATNYVICEDNENDGFEIFELTRKNVEVLGGQSEVDYEITYFESLVDAEANDNPLGVQTRNKENYQEIFAKVSNRLSGECYSISSFLLIVETEIAGDVKGFTLCLDQFDTSGAPVDLNQFDDEVYASNVVTPHADYQVTYYLSQPAADIGVDALVPDTFKVTENRTTIYARLENKEAGCFTTSNFDIIINETLAHKPKDLYLCDDATNDGKELFDLASQKADILNGAPGQVTFHASQFDADSGAQPLAENFENQTVSQEIFVRVENSINATCYDTTSFFIEVIFQPIAGAVEDYVICDDASNDGKEYIDLTQFDAAVFNGQSTTDYTITYHETATDANSGLGELPDNYNSSSQEVYTRIEHTINTSDGQTVVCFTTSKFNIIIDKFITANRPKDLYLCDDATNDGKELFGLASQKADILNGSTGQLTFHASQSDADSGVQPLAENFENQTVSQEIFVRVENSINATCFDTTSFFIEVIFQPIAGAVNDYVICDDASNDGKEYIDLTQFDAAVFNGQSTTDYTVTYHETATDANSGLGELPDNYNSSSQEIYTRIERTINTSDGQTVVCFTTSKFNIIIDKFITANRPKDLYLCDDATNEGKELFDIASQKADVLNGALGQVTFHASQSDADSGAQALAENFENQTVSQEIFVRVENSINATCFDTTSFFIEVIFQPIAGAVEDYVICDDASNDGKEYIDLTQFDAAVFNGQSTTDYTVTYHETATDANSGLGELPDNYNSSSQEIYTRIEHTVSTSDGQTVVCFTTSKFNIIIDKFITANRPKDLYLCDDATNEGKELFDIASQKADVLNGALGQVTFHASQSDADSGAQPLTENFENQLPLQEIFVRVENLENGSCFDTTSFFIEVTSQPIIDIIKTWYFCPGEDLELYVDSIHDEYLWSNGQSGSEIIINKAGTYSVTVYNIVNDESKCGITETIQVLETELPTSVEIITEDWTTSNNSIQVYVNGTENYIFSIDGDVYQSSNTFNDLEAGDYILYVKNEKDCLVYSEEVYLLNYPKFFTPNNDGYNDYWKINFSEKEPQTEIHIFDRYGKLITRLSALSQGWDGTLNGQLLATSDYWFVVNRPSKNKKYKGHFTLKR